jgi:hypothetical protein
MLPRNCFSCVKKFYYTVYAVALVFVKWFDRQSPITTVIYRHHHSQLQALYQYYCQLQAPPQSAAGTVPVQLSATGTTTVSCWHCTSTTVSYRHHHSQLLDLYQYYCQLQAPPQSASGTVPVLLSATATTTVSCWHCTSTTVSYRRHHSKLLALYQYYCQQQALCKHRWNNHFVHNLKFSLHFKQTENRKYSTRLV